MLFHLNTIRFRVHCDNPAQVTLTRVIRMIANFS